MKTIEQLTFENIGDADYYELAKSLTRAVIVRHFSYLSPSDKEDMSSEGMLKILQLLKDDNFDRTKSSMKNYLYTGIRNSITNLLYKSRLDNPTPEENFYAIPGPSIYDNIRVECIACGEIDRVIKRFNGRFDSLRPQVVTYLRNMGFEVKGKTAEIENNKLVGKIACLIIWNQ